MPLAKRSSADEENVGEGPHGGGAAAAGATAAGRGGCAAPARRSALHDLFGERVPGPAVGAAPEPARLLAAALAAGEDDVVLAPPRPAGGSPAQLSPGTSASEDSSVAGRRGRVVGRSPDEGLVDAEQRQVVDRRADLFAVGREHRVVVAAVDHDDRARFELPLEQDVGELVFDVALDGAPQRPGAERGVVALLDQQVAGGVGQLDGQALFGELLAGARDQQVDDAAGSLRGSACGRR